MSLSRTSLAPVVAAAGLLLLLSCGGVKKESVTDTTATDTSATSTSSTSITSTSPTDTATTDTAATGTTATSTTGTAPGKHYGRTKDKLGKAWGQNNNEDITVTFSGTTATTSPEPGEINANDPARPGNSWITWTGPTGVKLHVEVVTPNGEPSCIKGKVECKDNVCKAQPNPEQYNAKKEWNSVLCNVKIWKNDDPRPSDPEIVIDNCCP